MHSGPWLRASQSSAYRELLERVIIVIVIDLDIERDSTSGRSEEEKTRELPHSNSLLSLYSGLDPTDDADGDPFYVGSQDYFAPLRFDGQYFRPRAIFPIDDRSMKNCSLLSFSQKREVSLCILGWRHSMPSFGDQLGTPMTCSLSCKSGLSGPPVCAQMSQERRVPVMAKGSQ